MKRDRLVDSFFNPALVRFRGHADSFPLACGPHHGVVLRAFDMQRRQCRPQHAGDAVQEFGDLLGRGVRARRLGKCGLADVRQVVKCVC